MGTLLPYPYSPTGPQAEFRSQKIFPAGAKLHILGGFSGMGNETVTALGYGHHRRHPVRAYIAAKYIGNWQAKLIYRPVILRAIQKAHIEDRTCHRWLHTYRENYARVDFWPTEPEYGQHLANVAASFQQRLHRS